MDPDICPVPSADLLLLFPPLPNAAAASALKAAARKVNEKCDKAANVFEVGVEGMCCANCVKAVGEALEIDGVESVKVDVEAGEAWVR